jgi:protein-S-isoprenylcysteine O-methyltransferase Ste14
MAGEPDRNLLVGPLIANAIGTLFLLAGAIGLFVPQLAQSVPGLADPLTAWTLLGIGVVLDTWSGLAIVQRLRRKPR